MIDKQKFTANMSYLGLAYGKEYSLAEIELHYDFLKNYSNETMVAAIKNIIKKSKFLPKINEIAEECEKAKVHIKFDVIEYMKSKGYFHECEPGRPSEYDKTMKFIERGIVPDWLEADIKKYYRMMITETKQLEMQEQQLLEG